VVIALADGRTAEGEHWTLVTERQPTGWYVGVDVLAVDCHPFWSTGCILPGPSQREAVNLTTGGDDAGPSTLILALRADVRAAVVLLSDGMRKDLRLHALRDRDDVRLGALVFPRRLDVHRIDLYDASGERLPDPAVP
jgi:hypothetical protein